MADKDETTSVEKSEIQTLFEKAQTALNKYTTSLDFGLGAEELLVLAQEAQQSLWNLNIGTWSADPNERVYIYDLQSNETSSPTVSELKPFIEANTEFVNAAIIKNTSEIDIKASKYVDAKSTDVEALQSRLKILAAGAGDHASSLMNPSQIDGLHGPNTTRAIQDYIKHFDVKGDFDFSSTEARAVAVKTVLEDMTMRMGSDLQFQGLMKSGLTKLAPETTKHEVAAVKNVLDELDFKDMDEFKATVKGFEENTDTSLKEHFAKAAGTTYVKPKIDVAPAKTEITVPEMQIDTTIVAGDLPRERNADEYIDAYVHAPQKVAGSVLHINPNGRLRLLQPQDGGELAAIKLNSDDARNSIGGLDRVGFSASTLDQLGKAYDAAHESAELKNPEAGILVQIDGRGKDNYELIVTKDENGLTSAKLVTDSFLKENKAAYDAAKAQTPDSLHDGDGIKFRKLGRDKDGSKLTERLKDKFERAVKDVKEKIDNVKDLTDKVSENKEHMFDKKYLIDQLKAQGFSVRSDNSTPPDNTSNGGPNGMGG